MDPARNRGLYLALTGILLLLAATTALTGRPRPWVPTRRPLAFSAGRARVILEDLVGSGIPHPMGSTEDARIRARIVTRLSDLGFATELLVRSGLQ